MSIFVRVGTGRRGHVQVGVGAGSGEGLDSLCVDGDDELAIGVGDAAGAEAGVVVGGCLEGVSVEGERKRRIRKCLPSPPFLDRAKPEVAAERATRRTVAKRILLKLKRIKLERGVEVRTRCERR